MNEMFISFDGATMHSRTAGQGSGNPDRNESAIQLYAMNLYAMNLQYHYMLYAMNLQYHYMLKIDEMFISS